MPADLVIDIYIGKARRYDSGTLEIDVCGYYK